MAALAGADRSAEPRVLRGVGAGDGRPGAGAADGGAGLEPARLPQQRLPSHPSDGGMMRRNLTVTIGGAALAALLTLPAVAQDDFGGLPEGPGQEEVFYNC